MSFYLTLVASDKPLNDGHIQGVCDYMRARGFTPVGKAVWLDEHIAADISFSKRPLKDHIFSLRQAMHGDKIDIFSTGHENRRKKLLLADMDSTVIAGETLDEIAALAGIGEQIAAITARAMNGEIDFAAALDERVGLLKGQSSALLDQAYGRAKINSGAHKLVKTMKDNGAICALVSGGFEYFTSRIADEVGFDFHHGNHLTLDENVISGTVSKPILDHASKEEFLQRYAAENGLLPSETMAIGDGANDLSMLRAASLGIGFHPKEILLREVENCIIHGTLDAALYAQGYSHIA